MCQGIWLGGSTYEFLKGEAVHWVMHCDMQYPVDSFDLAKRLGFKIISYDELDEEQRAAAYETSEDAFFIDKDGEITIFYNNNMSPERIENSVIHEVSHSVLDHGIDESRKDIEETEAKFFTKYLKAPPPLIHQLPIISIDSIKIAFKLSIEAAEYAFNYYQKWLKKFDGNYKKYEIKLLKHCGFDKEVNKKAS